MSKQKTKKKNIENPSVYSFKQIKEYITKEFGPNSLKEDDIRGFKTRTLEKIKYHIHEYDSLKKEINKVCDKIKSFQNMLFLVLLYESQQNGFVEGAKVRFKRKSSKTNHRIKEYDYGGTINVIYMNNDENELVCNLSPSKELPRSHGPGPFEIPPRIKELKLLEPIKTK